MTDNILLAWKLDQLTTELESTCAITRNLRTEIRSMRDQGAPDADLEIKRAELEYRRTVIDHLHSTRQMHIAKSKFDLLSKKDSTHGLTIPEH